MQALTYTFAGTTSRLHVAVQTLTASGWRADCSVDSELDLTKALPPPSTKEKIEIEIASLTTYEKNMDKEPDGARGQASDLPTREYLTNLSKTRQEANCLKVSTGAFYQDGFGASIAWIQEPGGVPRTQAWSLGYDMVSKEPPAFVLEASILRALLIVEKLLTQRSYAPTNVIVTTGSRRTSTILHRWQKYGTLTLLSAAASEIVKVWHRLNENLRCNLRLQAPPKKYYAGTDPWDTSEGSLIRMAAVRFFEHGAHWAKARWGEQIARIPWTPQELKRHLKRKFREDERTAIELLSMEGSLSGNNYRRLGLNRAILPTAERGTFPTAERGPLKETLRRLPHSRTRQVVFANITCATRFKYFDESGSLLKVKCPNGCGEVDSLDHLLECHNVASIDSTWSFDEKVTGLTTMAIKTARNCPTIPIPIQSPHGENPPPARRNLPHQY